MQFRFLYCPFNWLENLRKAKLKEEKVAVGGGGRSEVWSHGP